MRIIICCSVAAAEETLQVRDQLTQMGHVVAIPAGIRNEYLRGLTEVGQAEKAVDKIEGDLIRSYFETMKDYDAVLVVNPALKGIEGYVGGNTLIEMAFAHVLRKPLYCLHALPDMPYSAELIALQPIILHGDLDVPGWTS